MSTHKHEGPGKALRNHVVPRDGEKDLRFSGEQIAQVNNRRPKGNRWTVLTLYKAVDGDFVCHRAGLSSIEGELPRHEAVVVPRSGIKGISADELVVEFFGREPLAKILYARLGLTDIQSPRVFVSYARSKIRDQQVLDLAARLRRRGIECEIDQYVTSPKRGWRYWMYEQVRSSDYTLVVWDKLYAARFEGREAQGGKGVQFEMRQLMGEDQNKVIPIVFDADDVKHIPSFLDATYYKVSEDDSFECLCVRLLEGQHGVPRPPLRRLRQYEPVTAPKQETQTLAHPEQWALLFPERGAFGLTPFNRLVADERKIVVDLIPEDPPTSAWIAGLRPPRRHELLPARGPLLGIAYSTMGCLGRVEDLKQVRQGSQDTWTLTLRIEPENFGSVGGMEMGTTQFSADEIAEKRARRILLDEAPYGTLPNGMEADMVFEILVRGINTPLQATESPFPMLRQNFGDGQLFLTACKLYGTLLLRLSGVVEHVLRLEVALRGHDAVEVDFEGVRARQYVNQPPAAIRIKGICPLATT